MSDFDLSEALDGSPELYDPGCERCCFNMTDVQDVNFTIDEGLDLVVSRNPKTLKSVANLLLVVNKMLKSLSGCGQQLSDDELCSAIMKRVVSETIVKTTESSSTGVKRTFLRINSVKMCTLCDTSQKDVCVGDLKLQAITLQGGHCESKVNFKMSKYITPCVSADEGQTVVLSLTNGLHMSCSMEDGNAVLILEECIEEELKNISNDGDMDRFLFYKRTGGDSMNSFESVKYRGWLISTSVEHEKHPVEMCKVDAANRLTSFRLN